MNQIPTFTPPVRPVETPGIRIAGAQIRVGSFVRVTGERQPVEIVEINFAERTIATRWFEQVEHWACYREGEFRFDQIEAVA